MFPVRTGLNNKGGREPMKIVINLLTSNEQLRTAPAK